ncbi:MAG: S8 family serine peptidase, partial [candidate division KSB1 bacterium]|nr:S8 family serine peptidase [candidate division KSB1 bacterium]
MPQKGFIRLWCLVIIFFLIIIIFSNFTDVLAAEGQTTTTGIGKVPKLQSILKELTDQYAIGELIKAESFAASRPLYIRDDKVRVMLELKPGATLDETRLQAYGVEIERKHEGFWRVLAPINSLRRMAQELEEVTYIHSPQKAHPEAISEGVSLSGASAWHTAGYKGQGVKVAVIDEGFEGLTNCIAAGELPSTLTKVNYTGATFETGGTHGVGVAEIVYDMAPQAQMYLIKIDDQSDLTLAKNYCISQGIKVINTSLGYYNSGGYDGTGPLCDIVNDAHSHGILWVKSAGNNGISHYKANYADPNSNNWHNFSSTVENNTLKNWWRIDGKIEKDADISIYLSWGWPTSNQDYDLYLYNNSGQVAASTNPQTGTEPPTEEIVIKAPSTDTYWIKVKKVNATGNQTLTLFSPGYELTYKHPSGSLSQPGDATGCFAVGMLRRENWTTGPLDSYSSRGPTYDGRIKPELVAPSNVTTWTYPAGMYWTSAAAPHAAGAAALVLSAYPSYNVSQVWSYLESNAIDMGTAGKDNDYGSGRLRLPAPPAATPAPTDLMALNSYNGAIPLAWNAPPGIQTESGGFPGDVLNNSLLLLSPKIENNLWKNSLETGSSIELSSLA